MAEISIYAELLLNIRQVTVVASLPSDCNPTTAVALSPERNVLTVNHGGQSIKIILPASVQDEWVPRIAPKPIKDLAFRLPVKEGISTGDPASNVALAQNDIWPACSMASDIQIACQSCQALLVKASVKTFKDLPSENWAEMMDFWHCHKPDTEDASAHQANGLQKGYGATDSIEPTVGVGLVNTTYLLLMQEDCNVMFGGGDAMLKVSWLPFISRCKL